MAQTEEYTIHPFDISNLHRPSLVIFLGMPGSGKTVTCRSVLAETYYDAALKGRDDYPLVNLAMYGSKGEDEYAGAVHPIMTHEDVGAEILKNNINRLLRMRRRVPKTDDADDAESVMDDDVMSVGGKRARSVRGGSTARSDVSEPSEFAQDDGGIAPKKEDLCTRILLDDIASSRSIFENPPCRWIWRKNRHVMLSMWMCIQFLYDCPRWMRQLSSVIFIRSIANQERNSVYKDFGHAFRSIQEFDAILNETTSKPGRCLVIDLRAAFGGSTKRHRPSRGAERFPAGGPVSYYDALDKETIDAVISTHGPKMNHPDVLDWMNRRGDPEKYDRIEFVE